MNDSSANTDTQHPANDEPVCNLSVGGSRVTLLGTAHVSRASADKVRELLRGQDYDAVAVELCPSRYHAIVDPDALSRMDLFQVIREGKASMVAAQLALGAFQQRLAEQFGIEPGAEMRVAIECALDADIPVLLIDREIGVTLRRTYRGVAWWKRVSLIGGLLASIASREKISEEDIESLKGKDMLESVFTEFAASDTDIYRPLIDERDRYMAASLRKEIADDGYHRVLAVVGAGHLNGIQRYLQTDDTDPVTVIAELDTEPPRRRWTRLIPWLIVALVVTGFVLGFQRNPSLGWELVRDWVLINGGLSAFGALLAGAHPLTVLTAFLAAPLTSLNPMIGAGFVAVAVEMYLRRPSVGDFERLRKDTAHLRGWWRNRVTRSLLVFLLSSLGSAIGTWVAGVMIYHKL